MKRFNSKRFVLRLIAGLALIGLAVYLGFALEGFTGPQSTMLQRTVFILSVLGTGLGGLMCIFLGFWGVLGSFIFILVISLPRVLPDPWNRYFSLVYLLLLFTLKPLLKWLSQRKAGTGTAQDSGPSQPQEPEPSLLPANSVVATNSLSGRTYQLFRRGGQISGYRVGGEIRGIDPDKLRVTPTDTPDFVYGLNEIQKIKSKPHNLHNICITFRAGGHTYYFVPSALTDPDALEAFFRPLAPESIPQKAKPQPTTPDQNQRRVLLSRLRTDLLAALLLIDLPWMFLNVPYKLFSVLALLLCPATLVLICLFPDDVTLEDKKKSADGRVDLLTPLIFSGMAPALRVLLDFNILDWPRLLIFAAVLVAAIVVCLFAVHKPLRKKIGTLLCLGLLCIFFAVGCIGQMNYLLDFSQPQSQSAQVSEMRISTSSRGPDRYILEVSMENGTGMELQVSKDEYQSLNTGDEITVVIFSGGLGIPYAFLG